MERAIASAYFAADYVIFAVRDRDDPSCTRVDRVDASTGPDTKKMDRDLRQAALGIAALTDGATLEGVGLICPGPFRTIDKDDPKYGLIGRNAEVPHWRNKNAITMFRKHLRAAKSQNADEVVIYLYNQGGATATGEFSTMYQSRMLAAREAGTLGSELKKIGNHLFVIADWSIQAGLIVEGEPFHGLSTINTGHHAVLPAPRDEFALSDYAICAAHPNRPCLDSLASLRAIKQRWPNMNSDVFIGTDDFHAVSLIAFYVAQMLSDFVLMTSPVKIVVGGRIADNTMFHDSLRRHFHNLLLDRENLEEVYPGYPQMQDLSRFIVPQADRDSGVKGGLRIVERLIRKSKPESVAQFEAYQRGIQPL